VTNDTKRDEYYRTITDESERLSRLIDNVLDYSRLEKGEYEAVPCPVEPVPVVRAAVEKLRPHALQAGFTLELDADRRTPRVAFDRDVLTQVVFNLVDNAIKYARDAALRTIVVACRALDDTRHVEVSVRDHGPGVPARDLGRIFEPFYRRGDELTRTTKGTGIGLALVKDLVESLGGTVSAADAPGGGLRVAVRLPIAPPE
jgi:signal transduction histidine kinase